MTIDAGDPEQVKERRTKAKTRRDQQTEDFRWVLSSAKGRAFVWRLLEECGIHQISFAGEETHLTAFREGKRNVGNWALAEVFTADANSYILMRQEAEKQD